MVSKLAVQTTKVKSECDELLTHVKARLKYRIELGTMKEQVLPKLRSKIKKDMADGYGALPQSLKDIENREKQVQDWTKYVNNATIFARNSAIKTRQELFKLSVMVGNYDPMRTKKNKGLSVERIEDRTAKKKAAIATIESTRRVLVGIDKDLK